MDESSQRDIVLIDYQARKQWDSLKRLDSLEDLPCTYASWAFCNFRKLKSVEVAFEPGLKLSLESKSKGTLPRVQG